MKFNELNEAIEIEYDNLDIVVNELNALLNKIGNNEPTLVEKAAIAHFLHLFTMV